MIFKTVALNDDTSSECQKDCGGQNDVIFKRMKIKYFYDCYYDALFTKLYFST